MKYAIIVEDKFQEVEEINNMDEALDVILFHTNYFSPSEDSIAEELINEKDFDNLAKEIALCCCNQEPATSNGYEYCKILNEIKNTRKISDLYNILPKLNNLLKENNYNVELFLNELTDEEYYKGK